MRVWSLKIFMIRERMYVQVYMCMHVIMYDIYVMDVEIISQKIEVSLPAAKFIWDHTQIKLVWKHK